MVKLNKMFPSFSVDDLKKAKAFYGKVLGLKVSEKEWGLMIGDLFIYQKPDHKPATYTVMNFEVKDIDKAVDGLVKKGVKFEQYKGEMKTDKKGISRWGKMAMAWFKDPAGNYLSLIQK